MKCKICGEEAKDTGWWFGDGGESMNPPAHMECVLKICNWICKEEDCGTLFEGDDAICPECGEVGRHLNNKDKATFRRKEREKLSKPEKSRKEAGI